MTKLQRSLFFWTLVAIFLVVAPLIVLHAKGYRFDFQRGVFVHSGTVSLKNNPQNVSIYVDGKIESSSINRINSSSNITGLIPKSYNLEVKANGYQDWSKKIDVHSGLATEFWNILLIRNEYTKKEYDTQNIERLFISPKNKSIAYTENSEVGMRVKILNIANNKITNDFPIPVGVFTDAVRQENVEWSPAEDFISVPVKLYPKTNPLIKNQSTPEDKYAYYILDPAKNTSFDLNDFLKNEDIRNVRWDPKDKNFLFYLSGNSLYRANITNPADITTIAKDVSAFDLGKNAAFYAQSPNELVFKSNLDGGGTHTQITSFYSEDDDVIKPTEKLIVYDESRIVFINKDRDLFLYNENGFDKSFKKIAQNITGTQFSDDGKKLLYWSDNEIFVYFLRDWNVPPIRSANENTSVTRYSENIKNVQWFLDYEHVIFSVGNQYKIIELDSRDRRNIMDLPKTSIDNSIAVYDHALEFLFFTDQRDGANYLNSIILPEPTTFLGL